MNPRLLVLSFLVVLAGCGRTTLQPCALGAAECECGPGDACNAGLVCTDGICSQPSVAPAGSGGYRGSGGFVATGGKPGSGGQPGSGGHRDTGGRGSGGIVGSGGTTLGSGGSGQGGSPGYGGTHGAVTFNYGQAVGSMTGYGWVALGAADSLSSPTCGGRPITSTEPCASAIDWPSSGLCVTGTIPAVTNGDYSGNWGIMVSANASLVAGEALGQSYQTMTFTVTGTPANGLRALVHRKFDQDSYNYCANMISGTKVSLSAFNTHCWDGSGSYLSSADVPYLDWIGVQIPSAVSAIQVSNLCLMAIVFD